MGWAGGVEVLDGVWRVVVVENQKMQFDSAGQEVLARKLIEVFEDADCDTIEDSKFQTIRRAYREMNA